MNEEPQSCSPCGRCDGTGERPPTKRRRTVAPCQLCDGRGYHLPRLPFAPLERRAVTSTGRDKETAEVLGISVGWLYRCRNEGLTWHRADDLATSIGCHPAEVWPEEWVQLEVSSL